jgi:hypothetical protein
VGDRHAYEYTLSLPTALFDVGGMYPTWGFHVRPRAPRASPPSPAPPPAPAPPVAPPSPEGSRSEFAFEAWVGCSTPFGGIKGSYKYTAPAEPSTWWDRFKDWLQDWVPDVLDYTFPTEEGRYRQEFRGHRGGRAR